MTVPFDPLTIQLMREVFEGHVCSKCHKPAERFKVLSRDAENEYLVFFCGDCFYGKNGTRWLNTDRHKAFSYPRIRTKLKLAD